MQLPQLSIDALIGGAFAEGPNNPVHARLWSTRVAVGVRKMYDVGPVALGFGARAGLAGMWQTFSTTRVAPQRFALAPQVDTLLRLDWHSQGSFFIGLEAILRVSAYTDAQTHVTKVPVEGLGQIGVGWQW